MSDFSNLAAFGPMILAIVVIWLLVRYAKRSNATASRFRNPANGYIETVSAPALWSLLFGVFYFAAKGLWLPAIFCVLFPPCWFFFPFMARGMVETHYLRQGWERLPA